MFGVDAIFLAAEMGDGDGGSARHRCVVRGIERAEKILRIWRDLLWLGHKQLYYTKTGMRGFIIDGVSFDTRPSILNVVLV